MSKRMQSWEKTFKKPEPTPKKEETPKKRGEKEVHDYVQGMSAQIRKYGERIPVKAMQELYDFVFDNKEDLITVLDHYLRTYTNPKRSPARPGGITDRRNKRISKILDYLIELKKNGKKQQSKNKS